MATARPAASTLVADRRGRERGRLRPPHPHRHAADRRASRRRRRSTARHVPEPLTVASETKRTPESVKRSPLTVNRPPRRPGPRVPPE